MKKIIALVLVLTMALSLFAACGGNKKATVQDGKVDEKDVQEAASAFSLDEDITITFYHTMGSNLRDVLEKYIVEFNKLYPNIHIEHSQVGSYDDVRDTIITEIAANNQPNIAYCYPDHVASYNLAFACVALDTLIADTTEITRADGTTETVGLTQAQIDDFIDGYYAEGACYGDGKMYTLPLSKSTEVLYYNKTFFEANNLQLPTTWDELEALCAKIKEIDPGCIPLGYDSESNWFITMTEQQGSPYTKANGDELSTGEFLFNDQQNIDFVKKFNEWYQKGYVTTQELYGSYTSGLFVANGSTDIKSYMSIGSSAGATHQRPSMVDGKYPFDVGIATIPQVDPANPKVISQGPSLCIFDKADTKEVLASWLFVKYLTTTVEFQAAFSMASGYVPVLESVGEHPVYKDYLSRADGGDYIAALSAKVCMEQKDAYYTSPAFNGSSVARDEVGLLMTQCLLLTGDVEGQIKQKFEQAIKNCESKAG